MYLSYDVAEHIGSRPYMEDRYCIETDLVDGWALFAVFDGHGGSYVSNFLKFHFKDILREHIASQGPDTIVAQIHKAFKKASKQLDMEQAMQCGSTVNAVLIKGKDVLFINTGDSRAVLGTTTGNLLFQTNDHKPDRPDEEQRIRDAGGFVFHLMGTYRVNGNLALSRSVGDLAMYPHVIYTPEITHQTLPDGAIIILGTDGIWDVIGSGEAIELVANHNISCNNFIARADGLGSTDNMTVITIHGTSQI